MIARTPIIALTLAATALLLVGCDGASSDLEKYIQQVRARPTKKIPVVPEVEPFKGFRYESGELRDPFKQFEAELKGKQGPVLPNTDREKEPLEFFVLNALKIVGTVHPASGDWALVMTPDGDLYRVTVGNYMGRNYGQIVEVSKQGVKLKEIIPDGFGGFTEKLTDYAMEESQ